MAQDTDCNMDKVNDFTGTLDSESIVIVAPEGTAEEFVVQKTLLCVASDYFTKALQSGFIESQDKKLRFPGWDADVVKEFLFWMYRGKLPNVPIAINTVAESNQRKLALVRLWMFADAHLLPKLQNAALQGLIELTKNTHTPSEVIREACNLAPSGCSLRTFFVTEARYEYLTAQSISNKDVAALAQVSGFLEEFIGPLKAEIICDQNRNGNYNFQAAHMKGFGAFKVPEK